MLGGNLAGVFHFPKATQPSRLVGQDLGLVCAVLFSSSRPLAS